MKCPFEDSNLVKREGVVKITIIVDHCCGYKQVC